MAAAKQNVCWYFLIGLVSGLTFTLIMTSSFEHSFQLGVRNSSVAPALVYTGGSGGAGGVSGADGLHYDGPSSMSTIKFGDAHYHHDDDHIARDLAKKVRVLCWVMTQEKNHVPKSQHVKATWGQRCNKLIFFSDAEEPKLPTIKLDVGQGRAHLTAKTMKAFDYIYKNHLDDYDWFMKADDDTYVIVENMRFLLAPYDPETPIYFGHHFNVIVKQGYFSGGAGYIVSKGALRRFGDRKENLCAKDNGAEDVAFGTCMMKLNVSMGDTRDALGRTRMHCFGPETHLSGSFPNWYYQYDKYHGEHKGVHNMSDYAVSFHYVSVEKMYALEFYIYHLRPFGIASGLQELNQVKQVLPSR